MATEEDNFDIDIYGDGGEDYQEDGQDETEVKVEEPSQPTILTAEAMVPEAESQTTPAPQEVSEGQEVQQTIKLENGHTQSSDVAQKIASTDDSTQDPLLLPKQAPQTQGLKRKDGADDRFIDPGATAALFISELHWWITDDDVRGWANQSQCEDELEDITFSEHKVNGKSKGQAYVLFKSPQAATAAKHKIESFGEGQQYTKKFTVSYTNPFTNPFRTLPKDGPLRNTTSLSANRSTSGGYGSPGGMNGLPQQQSNFNANNSNGGYRGSNRGGYNSRGAGMNGMSGYNNRGGYQPPMSGGFQGQQMGGFQNTPMGAIQPYGGFQNRGAMMGGMRSGPMGMRGGRGAMSPNGMMGMPMGGMGMGGMTGQMSGMGMSIPQMGGGMGMGMQGMQGFYNRPVTNTATLVGQYPSSGYTAFHPPNHGGAPGSMISRTSDGPNVQQHWGYNPAGVQPAPGSTSTQFPSSAKVVSTAFNPSPSVHSATLNRNESQPGQGGFQGAQAHYNPAFFPQQQGSQQGVGAGDSSWNPHGAKRTRQE